MTDAIIWLVTRGADLIHSQPFETAKGLLQGLLGTFGLFVQLVSFISKTPNGPRTTIIHKEDGTAIERTVEVRWPWIEHLFARVGMLLRRFFTSIGPICYIVFIASIFILRMRDTHDKRKEEYVNAVERNSECIRLDLDTGKWPECKTAKSTVETFSMPLSMWKNGTAEAWKHIHICGYNPCSVYLNAVSHHVATYVWLLIRQYMTWVSIGVVVLVAVHQYATSPVRHVDRPVSVKKLS